MMYRARRQHRALVTFRPVPRLGQVRVTVHRRALRSPTSRRDSTPHPTSPARVLRHRTATPDRGEAELTGARNERDPFPIRWTR